MSVEIVSGERVPAKRIDWAKLRATVLFVLVLLAMLISLAAMLIGVRCAPQ